MATNLIADLMDVLRQHLLAETPADPSGELASLPLGGLLLRWFNWRDRYIPAVPRRVHESRELSRSQAAVTHASALASIRSAITTGQDLTPRLSSKVTTAYLPSSPQQPLHSRNDLDLLLADWGIHHLHLSPNDDGGRTGDLLFAIFRPSDAYLLKILPHGSWTDESLLAVIVRNWPNAGLLLGSASGVALAQPVSAENRRRFRQGGVATFVEIDGTLNMPRGQTTAGTAIDHTARANQIMTTLYGWKSSLDADERLLAELATRDGWSSTEPNDWHPWIDHPHFGLRNSRSGDRIVIGEL